MQIIKFIKKHYYKYKLENLSYRIKILKNGLKMLKNDHFSSNCVDFCTTKAIEVDERELKRAVSELRRYKRLLKKV